MREVEFRMVETTLLSVERCYTNVGGGVRSFEVASELSGLGSGTQ